MTTAFVGFGSGDRFVQVGEDGCVDVAVLEVGARNADVDVEVIQRGPGDLVLSMGAGAANMLAYDWNVGPGGAGGEAFLRGLAMA